MSLTKCSKYGAGIMGALLGTVVGAMAFFMVPCLLFLGGNLCGLYGIFMAPIGALVGAIVVLMVLDSSWLLLGTRVALVFSVLFMVFLVWLNGVNSLYRLIEDVQAIFWRCHYRQRDRTFFQAAANSCKIANK